MVIRIIVFDFDLTHLTKKLLGIHGYDDMGKSCTIGALFKALPAWITQEEISNEAQDEFCEDKY